MFLEEPANRQRETGAAAVYASHDPEEALCLADRWRCWSTGRSCS